MTIARTGILQNKPLVSVVICTYNQQNFIRETLDSVLAQTYPNIEIIVSDDGSVDGTPDILREYGQRYPDKIKPVFSPMNTGIPSNINRGMKQRTGELTAWLDGDDLMLPAKIEKQVDFLLKHPEVTGCYHDAEIFDSNSGQGIGRMSELYNGCAELKQGRLKDWLIPRYYVLPSSIMALSAACPAHGYDEHLKHFSEHLFFAEVFLNGTLLAINDTLVRYRRHDANITGNSKARDASYEYELMAYAIMDARYPEIHSITKRLRLSASLTEAVRWHRQGEPAKSRAMLSNISRDGAPIKAVLARLGLAMFARKVMGPAARQPYQRPSWLNRMVRQLLS